MKRILEVSFYLISHALALAGIIIFLRPIATWYLEKIPALGIDLYNSVTSVALLQKHFSFWFNGYKDVWFAGNPLFIDFPRFHFYLMLPFANIFGLVRGVQMYVIVSLFLLVVSTYLLFYRVCKNIGLALLLAIAVMLSVNIYGAATWGGSIPYFATQFFLPLVLFFIVWFLDTLSARWLWAAALFSGLGFLGHPLPVVVYVLPASLLILAFYPSGAPLRFLARIKYIFKFLIGAILVSFIISYNFVLGFIPTLFSALSSLFQSVGSRVIVQESLSMGESADTSIEIAKFYKNQIGNLYSGSNEYLFLLLVAGIVVFFIVSLTGLFLKKDKKSFLASFAFFLPVVFVGGHVALNFLGLSFFSQGLYRAFWAFPIVLGAFVASLWQPLFRLPHKVWVYFWGIGGTFVFVVATYFVWVTQYAKVIDRIHKGSDTSSAFPEVLSLKTKPEEQEKLKSELTPSFLDPTDKNKRLYTSDATVNIWWNALFDMPLARGYVDPPTSRRAGIYLLDVSIGNDTIVRDLKFPEEMARKYALFFIDWFGIYYFEGGHLAPTANVAPSTYLADIFESKEEVTTYGAIHRFETASGRPEARFDLKQSLIFYKIKEEYVSPVIYGSNAPTILIIADYDGYEQVWRALAAENLNSRYVVPVWGDKYVDSLSKKDLSSFDAIVLHNYDYRNKKKAYSLLTDFVKNGGKLFIDTGGEVKDSKSDSLDELLPLTASERREIGREWDLKVTPHAITEGIDFSAFGPPIFGEHPWKFSYPVGAVDENSQIILANRDKPILIERSLGQGKVIWSGMNLAYHFNQYTSIEEGKFFKNIIGELVSLRENEIVATGVKWERPEKINISLNSPVRGIIVKEELYPVWSVKGEGDSSLKIYPAGPTYPGFMYIPVYGESSFRNLVLSYTGEPRYWIQSFVSILSVLLILELVIFNGRLVGAKVGVLYSKFVRKVFSWWEKEENEN